MKLIQKWMVVPWQENKEMTPQEKIKEIYASKTIDEGNKQRLINKFINESMKKEEIQIDPVNNQVEENKNTDTFPTDNFETNDNFIEELVERRSKKRKRDPKKKKQTTANQTFENPNDYLPPGEQTRSKTQNRKSFLNLSKQKNYKKKIQVPVENIFNPANSMLRWENFINQRNGRETQ
jgi:hypothetical protein